VSNPAPGPKVLLVAEEARLLEPHDDLLALVVGELSDSVTAVALP